MIRPQYAAVDRQRLFKQRFSIIIPPLGAIQFGKVIQAWCCIRMIRPQYTAGNRQRLIIQRLCIIIPPLGTIQPRKVIQTNRRIRVIRPQHTAADPKRLIIQPLCLRIPPSVVIHQGEIVERRCIFISRLSMFCRNLFQDFLMQRHRFFPPSHPPTQVSIGLLML